MSLKWKEVAKRYKNESLLLQQVLDTTLSDELQDLVAAALEFKRVHETPRNLLVPLIGPESIEAERARKALFRAIESYRKNT